MNCPNCKGYKLEPLELEPSLLVGSCRKCSGTLVSLMNYRYWADLNADKLSQQSEGQVVEASDNSKAQACPKCSKLMTKYQIGEGSANRLDLCGSCDEVWLDKGEWQLIKRLDLADKLPKIFTDAWQKNIRAKRRETQRKQRFEDLLGTEDFNKLDEFKNWIDAHPEKTQITQYLIANFE